MSKTTSGFTIVEILIVIVVIGILAAITIVSYNGIQNRAYDTTVQADLKNAHAKIQVETILSGGNPPQWSSDLPAMGLKATTSAYTTVDYNYVYCAPYPISTSKNFGMIGQSKSGNIFVYSHEGSYEYTGSWTMSDYADICVEVTDDEGTFDGDFAGNPEFHVIDSGFRSNRSPQWATWATGG